MKRGFDIENCQRLALKNFTIDYLAPSNTQVQLTAIDPVQRTFTYTVMPGWADPKTFTDTGFGTPELLAVFFRNGELISGTGLAIMSYPISGNTLSIEPSDTPPWTQSSILSTLRAGDTVVVADDIGADPIDVPTSKSTAASELSTCSTPATPHSIISASHRGPARCWDPGVAV
jgi:hypothetical protein